MITRVRLKNWKSHEETELKLGQGTNVLVGIMGSGKSAVLEAISYGLFGTLPAVRNRKITLDDLIRKRPVKKDFLETEVGFTTPTGDEYKVKRVVERGKGTTYAELRGEDGTLIEKPNSTNVTEHVTSLLGIDYDFFERMIYAEQNQLDRFLTLEPRERRKKVDELLKINKFEKARKSTTTLVNRLKDRKADRKEDLKELEGDDEIEALSSLEEELEETKAEKDTLVKELSEIKPELEKVEKKLGNLNKIKEKIESFSKRIESIRGKLEALDEQINNAKEKLGKDADFNLEDLKKRKNVLENSLRESKEKVEELESKLSSNIAEISELKTERRTFENNVDELGETIEKKEQIKKELSDVDIVEISEKLENLEKKREEIRESVSTLTAHVAELNDTLEDLKKVESTCPICDRPLKESHRKELIDKKTEDLQRKKAAISDLKIKISKIEDKISEKKSERDYFKELERKVTDLPDLKSRLNDIEKIIKEKEHSLEEKKTIREVIREKLENGKKKIEKVRSGYEDVKKKIGLYEDLKSARKSRMETEKEESRISEKLSEKKEEYDEEEVKELEKRHQDLIRKQERVKTRLDEIKKLIEQKEKLVENIRKKKETLERRRKEVEFLTDSINSLNKFQRALSKSQTSLRRQVIEAVNGMMNDIWDSIYPYEDFQKIRLSIEEARKTSDYELQVMDSAGDWNPVEGVTSGGERTCASLTLRIAFAVVLAPSLSWLVLDEPTHNLDSEGIDNLSEIFRDRVPKVVEQLLLITHEKRLESAVSGYLYRFSRDKSVDGPTEVERVYERG